jgi:hypothetical protein
MTDGIPIIRDTDEEARAHEEALHGALDLKKALVQLGRPFNYHDFLRYPLDEPFPENRHTLARAAQGIAAE